MSFQPNYEIIGNVPPAVNVNTPTYQPEYVTIDQTYFTASYAATASYVSNAPSWKKITKEHTDFAAPGLTNDISIYTLQASEYIHDIKIIPTVDFEGGTINSYKISVGISGILNKYCIATNVFTGNSTLTNIHTPLIGLERLGGTTDIRAEAVSIAGNLDEAVAGTVLIYILTSILP